MSATNTKKTGRKKCRRMLSLFPKTSDFLDWLKAGGINFSMECDAMIQTHPLFKEFLKEKK